MKITGNTVELDGDEMATAIDAYLKAHRISVTGPRTVTVVTNWGEQISPRDCAARVYVDPSGRLVDNREPR